MRRAVAGLIACAVAAGAAEDRAQAVGHDDAWRAAWVAHAKRVLTDEGKTKGLVLQIGDSITHANPYSQWPRGGAGRTAADLAVVAWCHADTPFSRTQNDPANANGFYLAAADTTGARGMTCASGLDTAEFLAGDGNGGPAMPDAADRERARAIVADATYDHNLRASTLATAFADAQAAVLMLGTNDLKDRRPAAEVAANLGKAIDLLEAKRIVVVLSTIPPHPDPGLDALDAEYAAAITALARQRALPLIDYRAEILARRPGTTWNGTLIGAGDVHPTASGNGHEASSDPYADGGDPASGRTGAACADSGYLLRSWLTIQKLGQLKALVVDAPADAPAKGAPSTPTKKKPGAKTN